ncbi:NAD-dependent epimerase/dehydratase family protein [Pandoraea sputorum]
MQRILITGGAGFIGTHLSRRLLELGYQVRILDPLTAQVHGEVPTGVDWLMSGDVEFIRGSVTSAADWSRALVDVDHIVHLAAETGTGQSMYEVARYCEVNSMGTALLFDVLGRMPERRVQRVVLTSSRSVYGEGAYRCDGCGAEHVYPGARLADQLRAHQWEPLCPHCGVPLVAVATTENDAVRPASIYAATKFAQEDLVRIACDSMGLGYAIFRLQNVYGEGQSLKNPYTGILSIFSTRIRRGLQLPIFEDGKETRDFVHVADVVEALVAGVRSETPANDVLNVGSGVGTSVEEVARELTVALGGTPDVKVTGQFRLGDIRHNFADVSRLNERLGVKPQVSLSEGLSRFAAWVKTQPLPEDKLEQANKELVERKLMG